MTWSSSAFSPARATRSTRWRRRFTISVAQQLAGTEHLHGREWKLVHAYGLRPDLLAMSHVWQAADDRQEFVIAAKGAPEAIADLCHLNAADLAALTQSVDAMAAEGLRVLGVARASFAGRAMAGLAARFRVRVPGPGRPCRSAAAERARRRERMPVGRHQGGHDHRRLPGDRQSDRPPGGPRRRRSS